MKRSNQGALPFLLGFFLAAIPLTFWLLSLSADESNGAEFLGALIVELCSGIAARELYLRIAGKKPN
ncbi:hypothetical protein [Pseudomonas sp. GOM6]|uniref:hypothetical protein n=1 Tax=Pseudomonas sp. GOM6 TaxID=3036944 RepID=UPI00240A16D2|nr:hypothetical protein [Pseudomonas sp. GOM6]MDG1580844.1 hypothetical protein [Pseudomonas sp. GOM6]